MKQRLESQKSFSFLCLACSHLFFREGIRRPDAPMCPECGSNRTRLELVSTIASVAIATPAVTP